VYILPVHPNNTLYVRDLIGCALQKPWETSGTIVTGSNILAESNHEPWIEVDGEVLGPLPVSITVAPEFLSLIIP
jgi:diacylglycerol kinase family enzyme